MENNKKNKGLVIFLIIVILGLVGYMLIDKGIISLNAKNDTKDKPQEEVKQEDITITKEEVNSLINKYYIKGNTSDSIIDLMNDDVKSVIAINNTNYTRINCSEVYNELALQGMYYAVKGDVDLYCYKPGNNDLEKDTSKFGYDESNMKYKEMFKTDKNMDKKDVIINNNGSYTSFYDYNENINSFVEVYPYGVGYISIPYLNYIINDYKQEDSKLIVDIKHITLSQDMNGDGDTWLTKNNLQVTQTELDNTSFVDNYYLSNKDEFETYEMTFVLDNDHYIFDNITKK